VSPAEAPLFRPATPADRPLVEALLQDAALPTAGVAELFAVDAASFIVADDPSGAGGIVAAAGVEPCGDHALLRSVVVRSDWQRRGLGERLVESAVRAAESRGVHALYLLTLTADHYFPRFGFERIGRDTVPPAVAATEEFTSACPASAVTMCKTLTPSGRYTAPAP
jgi:amino-acid N-acetyltransferase